MSKLALVVDDDPLFRELLVGMLSRFDIESVELDSGDGVEELLVSKHFDALFLDIVMEGKEGIETLVGIQSLDEMPPVVAISSQLMYLENASCMGADATLVKPIYAEPLENVLKQLELI